MTDKSHVVPCFFNQFSVPAANRRLGQLAAFLATVAIHAALLALAFWLALAVRFDFHLMIPTSGGPIFWPSAYFLPLVALVVAIKISVWIAMGIHRGTWRYVSFADLLALITASQISLALIFAVFIAWRFFIRRFAPIPPFAAMPETVFLLDCLFGCFLIGGARLIARLVHEERRAAPFTGSTRLLIIGAGDAAEGVLREIARMPQQPYRVVGLLDDAPRKQKMRIHHTPVLGTIADLPAVCRKNQIHEILIAIPSAGNQQMRRIMSLCRRVQADSTLGFASGTPHAVAAAIKFRTVPSMADLIAGRGNVGQFRDVSVNDLLGRDAVEMDLAAVGGMVHGQIILISGAGGSIGSELCRAIVRFDPSRLVLLDKAENAIFEIERELARSFPALPLAACIGDISDPVRMEQLFADHKPAVVFHAAAHKHVPLAEKNPGEAIRNNLFGTKTLADTAARFAVRQFVMISTDKAVNPSSIMGATKRCAEIYCQTLARRSRTNFITVRFGNVLGSNGSVVPIFKQQIAAGGPVTVTHPEMRRYFMTIPEAAQLVLQAAALGRHGEIFVLDMGAPVRILDLARDLITLSGLRPETDIPIVFTGLRPGEKLYEELSTRGENMLQTRHPKIAIWNSPPVPMPRVQAMLDELDPLQHCDDRAQILTALQTFIPEMQPWQAQIVAQTRPANPVKL